MFASDTARRRAAKSLNGSIITGIFVKPVEASFAGLFLDHQESVQDLLKSLEIGVVYGLDDQVHQKFLVRRLGRQLDDHAIHIAAIDVQII